MSDNPTPVEGKGDEMIPQRGIPFEEEPLDESQSAQSDEDFSMESINELLDQIPTDTSEGFMNIHEEASPDVIEEEFPPAPEELEASEVSEKLLPLMDIDEIRSREQELAEDFNVTPPDFEGDADEDFATARVPVTIADNDLEAILSESTAIVEEEEVFPEDEPVMVESVSVFEPEPETFATTNNLAVVTEEEVTKETITQPATPTQPQSTISEKETRVTRKQALIREESIGHPGPTSEIEEDNAPILVKDLKASKKLLELLVPNSRVEELWKRADRLQGEIFQEINELSAAQKLLEQIRSAKNLILSDKSNYEEAERALNEVEYRVIYGQRAKKWSGLGYLLLLYEVAFGIAAIVVVALLLLTGVEGLNLQADGLLSSGEIYIGILAALFGCLGGVAGALFALWRYVTEQKFNPQFSMWYVTQPIIGLTVGIVIYLIIKIGLNITVGSATADVGSPLIPCLLAYLVGYQQNVFLDLAKQVFKQFKIGEKEESGNENVG